MQRKVDQRSQPARDTEWGITMIELLVVIVIVSLLAMVATVSYSRYARSARGAQAVAVLTDIASREEAYFGTFSVYLPIAAFHPALGSQGTEPKAKRWSLSTPAAWSQLGVKDPGQTYFQFQVNAGAAGVAASAGIFGVSAASLDTSVPWFIARAQGDLRGDGKLSDYVITSGRSTVISREQ